MKDKLGKELKLGDKIVATGHGGYAELFVGEVIGFTPKMVRVNCIYSNGLRTPNQVVMLERNPTREQELLNPKVSV